MVGLMKYLRYSSKIISCHAQRSISSHTTAIADIQGELSYGELARRALWISEAIKATIHENGQQRIAFLTPNNRNYVSTQYGIWKSNHVCVPLCKSHPSPTLEYYLKDSKSSLVLATKDYVEKVYPITRDNDITLLVLDDILKDKAKEDVGTMVNDEDFFTSNGDYKNDAMILYTSGTTGPPKGAVLSHGNLAFQTSMMAKAWAWTKDDVILHVLPLHHTHGIVNCLLTPLSVGAKVVMLPDFEPAKVWAHLLANGSKNTFKNVEENPKSGVNVFMAVPTIYAKLSASWKSIFHYEDERREVRNVLRRDIRLMVSGSAALPQPLLEAWQDISGHVLLERFGMTEIGMALTNPLQPESQRIPGCVGKPFPGVEARLAKKADDDGKDYDVLCTATATDFKVYASSPTNLNGELQIKGPGVFKGYFGKADKTKQEFTKDGWFKTGDTAAMDEKTGVFKILGRTSVDIIKSGGYKISALDIERTLLGHPKISDVAVVGLEDETWGQKICAVLALKHDNNDSDKTDLTIEELQNWSEGKMPSYYKPREIRIMTELPRNNMGKVNKKDLIKKLSSK